MMKNLTKISVLLLAIVFMNCSCEKNDPVVPDEITVNQLVGNWDFQSLEFDGDVYNTPEELSNLNVNYDFIQIDLVFTTINVTISSTYLDKDVNGTGNWSGTYPYTLNGNIIFIDTGYLEFEIMNTESLLNNEDVLELRLNDGNNDMPKTGVYTFH